MTGIIQLTDIGSSHTFFKLFSDVTNFNNAFATNVTVQELIDGYVTDQIPDGSTKVRIMSDACGNYKDVPTTGIIV